LTQRYTLPYDVGYAQLPSFSLTLSKTPDTAMPEDSTEHVALIGLGAIGISFAALYLRHTKGCVSVYDTRNDLEEHLSSVLPGYIDSDDSSLEISHLRESGRLRICSSLEEACHGATIVQEQGPENPDFKRSIWTQIESSAPANAHFWSSTSGIAASVQNQDMIDKTRLLVVHPFNPPHILPLLEIVPSTTTNPNEVEFARRFFVELDSGHRPVVIRKELPGFVGNRLAFALLREACSLVQQEVVSAQDVDTIMEVSLGPRWAVQGIFKSYNQGGGVAGIQAFFNNLSGTIQNIWDSLESVNFAQANLQLSQKDDDGNWENKVVEQTIKAYGMPTPEQFQERDVALRKVLEAQRGAERG
ncbi:3-hydroxyacyl- dehydrogenase, partial [Colletotrichum incanum]